MKSTKEQSVEKMPEETIYFNSYLISKNNASSQPLQTDAVYSLNTPILADPSKWKVGLASLSLPQQYMPLCIWSNDYSVGIYVSTPFTGTAPVGYTGTYGINDQGIVVVGGTGYTGLVGGTGYTGALLFEAVSTFVADTNPISDGNNSVYHPNQLCSIFNAPMATLKTNVNLFYPGLITQVPTLFFDQNSSLFKIMMGLEFDTIATVQLLVNKLWFDQVFYAMEHFIDFTKTLSLSGLPQDYFNVVVCAKDYNNLYKGTLDALINDATGTFRVISQKYQSFQSTNKIWGIRVKMSQTPIRYEREVASGTTWTQSISTQNLQEEGVLIDLADATSSWNDQGKLVYFPQVIHFHNIDTKTPLQRFNIELFIVDTQNNIYPFSIPYGYMAQVKLKFVKEMN